MKDSMASKWLSEEGAVSRVKVLLEQAGIPLEIQVAELCNEFCRSNNTSKDVHLSSETIVYSAYDADGRHDYREVDRRVQVYEEIPVSRTTGIQLIVDMPIECKYRRDVEFFSFDSNEGKIHQRFPIYGDLRGSKYFESLSSAFRQLSTLQSSNVVSVEIKSGETPGKVYDENLIYNSAGALYDFILSDIAPDNSSLSNTIGGQDRIIDQLGIFEDFQSYISENHYYWAHVLSRWIASLSNEKCKLFNQSYFLGDRPLYHGIQAFLPIVCVNGPIYNVMWSSLAGIQTFDEIPFCLTSIRKRLWPGLASTGLMVRSPEVPVVVTNAQNLRSVLEIGFMWYEEIRAVLTTASPEIIDRWALEASLSRKVERHYASAEGIRRYRSDLDFEI